MELKEGTIMELSEAMHKEHVEAVLEELPDEEELIDLADFYKLFSDSTRVRILSALSSSELCVYDLALVVGMSQSAVSHQLRILKTGRLVSSRREGRVVFYRLSDDHVRDILTEGLEHVRE